MTMSPGSSKAVSCASSASTTAAGTISQTARGGVIFSTMSCSDDAPVAPSFCNWATAAGLMS